MSYSDRYTTHWTSSDFTKHGYIATYALGECRCDKCSARWIAWNEVSGMVHRREVMRQATRKSKISRKV
jgi:hypothetical protein